MGNCDICGKRLAEVRHTVDLQPGCKQIICHACHVEVCDKITEMTIEKAEPREVNGL